MLYLLELCKYSCDNANESISKNYSNEEQVGQKLPLESPPIKCTIPLSP